MRLASDQASNIGGSIEWWTPDGKKVDRLLYMYVVGCRTRSVARFDPEVPVKLVLRVSNRNMAGNYQLGLFAADDPILVPFLARRPDVGRVVVGEPVAALLDGDSPRSHAA